MALCRRAPLEKPWLKQTSTCHRWSSNTGDIPKTKIIKIKFIIIISIGFICIEVLQVFTSLWLSYSFGFYIGIYNMYDDREKMREMEEERNHLQENLAYFRYLLLIIIIHLVARGMSKHNHSRSFVFFHNCNFYPKPLTMYSMGSQKFEHFWNHIFRRSIAVTFYK